MNEIPEFKGIVGGGPAFPCKDIPHESGGLFSSPGLSILDYFAVSALAGLLAADGNDPRWTGKDTSGEYQRGGGKWLDPAGVAEQAYDIAAAMLAERARRQS